MEERLGAIPVSAMDPASLPPLRLKAQGFGPGTRELPDRPNVLRVVALSGGYTREDANSKLARNHGMIASFSRALTEGLTAQQSDEEFDRVLDDSIASIYAASTT